jgi:hypothetical protein
MSDGTLQCLVVKGQIKGKFNLRLQHHVLKLSEGAKLLLHLIIISEVNKGDSCTIRPLYRKEKSVFY